MSMPVASTEIVIGQYTLRVSKPSLLVLSKFESWCRQQIEQSAAEFCRLLPEEGRAPVLAEAMRLVANFSILDESSASFMTSPNGIAKLLFIATESSSPALRSHEELLAEISYEDLTRISKLLLGMMGVRADPTRPNRPASPIGEDSQPTSPTDSSGLPTSG